MFNAGTFLHGFSQQPLIAGERGSITLLVRLMLGYRVEDGALVEGEAPAKAGVVFDLAQRTLRVVAYPRDDDEAVGRNESVYRCVTMRQAESHFVRACQESDRVLQQLMAGAGFNGCEVRIERLGDTLADSLGQWTLVHGKPGLRRGVDKALLALEAPGQRQTKLVAQLGRAHGAGLFAFDV